MIGWLCAIVLGRDRTKYFSFMKIIYVFYGGGCLLGGGGYFNKLWNTLSVLISVGVWCKYYVNRLCGVSILFCDVSGVGFI